MAELGVLWTPAAPQVCHVFALQMDFITICNEISFSMSFGTTPHPDA
jgi:hypothetical protein